MIEKKLLTLAAVVGILACGACFLPPLPQKKASLPPALASVHVIAIRVEDGTASNLFDPRIMSNAASRNFNQLWQEFPVRTEAYNAVGPSNAVLRITVLHNTASCKPGDNGNQFCSFDMIASFTLTASDGRILQSRPQESWKFGVWQKGNSRPENLDANPFRQEAAYSLAMTIGNIFLLSEHSN